MTVKIRNINHHDFNKQLALPLAFKTVKNRENFLVSKSNEAAVKLVENSKFWQNKEKINSIPAAIIYGPTGCGKTHLSYIFQQLNDCIVLKSLSISNLESIKNRQNFIIDDFTPGKQYPSELVMHFLNRVANNEGSILFLSKFSAFEMDWKLDDLNSRIRSLISSEIKPPDDVLLFSFLVKYSNDKNLLINDKQIIYILERLERNFENAINIIDRLDLYSLEKKEKVSLKSIKFILSEKLNSHF